MFPDTGKKVYSKHKVSHETCQGCHVCYPTKLPKACDALRLIMSQINLPATGYFLLVTG